MEPVNKIEYNLRDLGTRSVTLFPAVAQISREIKDVDLKPGTNEISIVGLSPTVDEESIKVQGSGSSSAIITGIAVESNRNHELFDDVYPDSEDDKSDASDEDGSEESDEDEEDEEDEWPPQEHDPEVRDAQSRLTDLQDAHGQADETVASAAHRLKILDLHATMLHDPNREAEVDIEMGLAKYKQERAKAFEDHTEGTRRQRDLREQMNDVKREISKLKKREQKKQAKEHKAKERTRKEKEKAKERARKDKEKARSKQAKRDEERTRERARVRDERLKFWPRLCYSVCVTVECNTISPTSSRRTSIASEAELAKPAGPDAALNEAPRCDLVLLYVTGSAGWSPSYDLQLSTTTTAAALCFDAQLRNTTSETWANCKVTLSTPQASLGGFPDAAPTLQPWKIKLSSKDHGIRESNILRSSEELDSSRNISKLGATAYHMQKPRHEMFWGDSWRHQEAPQKQQAQQQRQSVFANATNVNKVSSTAPPHTKGGPFSRFSKMNGSFGAQGQGGGLFGSANTNTAGFAATSSEAETGGGLFGGSSNANASGDTFGSANPQSEGQVGSSLRRSTGDDHDDDGDADEATLAPFAGTDQDALDFGESVFEETGFTTTYDLPGLKTLGPKSTSSKQRVASLKFTNVVFSHTVVAKYSPAAYLKARVKNTSKLTLLRGRAGLTLDGGFMGHTTLPRCSAGDQFSLGLGVDPAIKVVYPKPDVRRVTTGVFSKENSSAYVRTLSLQNTRVLAGKAVSILVQDQVPVSEDERLRVDLANPRGLSVGGGVATGDPDRDAKQDKNWGEATAVLKKGGEINWHVSLNAGKAVRLSLEYTVALPSGDVAVQCW